MASKIDFRNLIKTAEAQGWRVEEGRKHLKWLPPKGQFIVSSKTPSDHRAIKNHTALCRRAGLVLADA